MTAPDRDALGRDDADHAGGTGGTGGSGSPRHAAGSEELPSAVLAGRAQARVHIALHGCKQGYNYVNYVRGLPDTANQPPYGNRYITTTGYNHIAESNDIIVLYPQVEGSDGGDLQNPDGCWDWWGYSSPTPRNPDYYSKNAVQIRAIAAMLERLGG